MDGDGKKPLRIIITTDFYKLHENKGKALNSNNSRNLVFTRLKSINCLKNIEQNGNCNRKCGSRTGKSTDVSVIQMFDHLIGRVHMVNQNGLQSLQKI